MTRTTPSRQLPHWNLFLLIAVEVCGRSMTISMSIAAALMILRVVQQYRIQNVAAATPFTATCQFSVINLIKIHPILTMESKDLIWVMLMPTGPTSIAEPIIEKKNYRKKQLKSSLKK